MSNITYGTIQSHPMHRAEHNDCAVVATTVATGLPYDAVHKKFTQLGRRPRGRTPHYITQQAVRELGFRTINVTGYKSKTVVKLEQELAGIEGRFLVRVQGHILCIKDGVVEDWTRGRQHRIKEVVLVVDKDDTRFSVDVADLKPAKKPAVRQELLAKPTTAPKQKRKRTGAVATCRAVFINLDRQEWENKREFRDAAIAKCMELGIRRHTAGSQFYSWYKNERS